MTRQHGGAYSFIATTAVGRDITAGLSRRCPGTCALPRVASGRAHVFPRIVLPVVVLDGAPVRQPVRQCFLFLRASAGANLVVVCLRAAADSSITFFLTFTCTPG